MHKIVFDAEGEFQAVYKAQKWCEQRGISVGANQRGSPRGLIIGDALIAKWRNLSDKDKSELDGTMTGDMRNGPVFIELKTISEDK